METALKSIFDSIKKGISDTLEADLKGTLVEPNAPVGLMQSGETPFKFHLDENGKSTGGWEDFGYGATANCTAWIKDPDATYYLVKITSNNGADFQWQNVKINQKLEFKLKMKYGGKTKVTVETTASVKNTDGNGTIKWTF